MKISKKSFEKNYALLVDHARSGAFSCRYSITLLSESPCRPALSVAKKGFEYIVSLQVSSMIGLPGDPVSYIDLCPIDRGVGIAEAHDRPSGQKDSRVEHQVLVVAEAGG